MAFFCPMLVGRKPTTAKYTVFALKKARKRKIPVLQHAMVNNSESLKMESSEDDDNDSGYSQTSSSLNGLPPFPDLAKTELALCLRGSSVSNQAFLKARVLWDYQEKSGHYFKVKKDEVVNILYRENDQVYVINGEKRKGFLPFSYCTLLRKSKIGRSSSCAEYDTCGNEAAKITYEGSTKVMHKCSSEPSVSATELTSLPGCKPKLNPRSKSGERLNTQKHRHTFQSSCAEVSLHKTSTPRDSILRDNSLRNSSLRDSFLCDISLCDSPMRDSSLRDSFVRHDSLRDCVTLDRKAPETYYRRLKVSVMHFRRDGEEPAVALFDFRAADENDVSVRRGETVCVLNKEDPDWWWVERENGDEGFVPTSYITTKPSKILQVSKMYCSASSTSSSEASSNQVRFQDPLCTIHSYEREESEFEQEDYYVCNDSQSEDDTDEENESLDSKWGVWC